MHDAGVQLADTAAPGGGPACVQPDVPRITRSSANIVSAANALGPSIAVIAFNAPSWTIESTAAR